MSTAQRYLRHSVNVVIRANSIEDAVRRGQRQMEQAKLKLSMQMDDKTFQNLLLETQVRTCPDGNSQCTQSYPFAQVMVTKDHTKWNLDMLQELIEGPLLNHKRMEEAIKVSRYIRKLMAFFHPFSHRFSDLSKVRHRCLVSYTISPDANDQQVEP